MEADIILIQEPTTGRGSTARHDGFRWIKGEEGSPAKCWVAVNKASGCRVTELKEATRECRNYVQVLDVRRGKEAVTLVNVYDQVCGRERPAQQADWGKIMGGSKKVVVAGDMNAHGKLWSPRAKKRRNATFWEGMIEKFGMVVWNSEKGTRSGPGTDSVSIIDLTLSSQGATLNWSLLEEEATGSDHEVICWEILGSQGTVGRVTTGWDISSWDPRGKSGGEKDKAEQRRATAETTFRDLMEQSVGRLRQHGTDRSSSSGPPLSHDRDIGQTWEAKEMVYEIKAVVGGRVARVTESAS
jgi:hypothetical protein